MNGELRYLAYHLDLVIRFIQWTCLYFSIRTYTQLVVDLIEGFFFPIKVSKSTMCFLMKIDENASAGSRTRS